MGRELLKRALDATKLRLQLEELTTERDELRARLSQADTAKNSTITNIVNMPEQQLRQLIADWLKMDRLKTDVIRDLEDKVIDLQVQNSNWELSNQQVCQENDALKAKIESGVRVYAFDAFGHMQADQFRGKNNATLILDDGAEITGGKK